MSNGAALLVALGLLIGNAFFVGAEFALISARRTQIEPRVATGSRTARITLRAMERVSLMMAGAQLGITVCSLGLGAVGEPAVAHLLEVPFAAAGLPAGLVHPVALVISLAIVVFLHMVLGEMVPKNIALAGPDRAALVLGPVLYGIVWVLRPVIWLINAIANLVLRLLRVQPQEEVTTAFTREEVTGFVVESGREGLLDDDELSLLTGALGFEDLTAADVVIPAAELVSVAEDVTPAELEQLCASTGFSRFPVRSGADDFSGYVHLKDFLQIPPERRALPIEADQVRSLATVSATDSLREVMATMQRRGAHLARLAADGDPRPTTLVALEDVLEELVGEVRDATSPAP